MLTTKLHIHGPRIVRLSLPALVLICGYVLPLGLTAQPSINWWTLDGGGGMSSTGADYALSGTIGQPDAGLMMTGGDYALVGGFWAFAAPPPPEGCPGDYDCDGDIDFFDIDLLLAALGGEASWAAKYQETFGTPPPCDYLANADTNGDGVVDFFDIDGFLSLLGTNCP